MEPLRRDETKLTKLTRAINLQKAFGYLKLDEQASSLV